IERVRAGGIEEVVLALNTDVESDATASFLRDRLRAFNVRVTRIAFGLPAGSGIGYSDPVTLQRALEGRREW
ncbi:MAG: toprim domain-containing protein, partial [Kiritimatiellae bacterium]|nr:toprim domain-containing protein [Kiritimatiellia bacterium]